MTLLRTQLLALYSSCRVFFLFPQPQHCEYISSLPPFVSFARGISSHATLCNSYNCNYNCRGISSYATSISINQYQSDNSCAIAANPRVKSFVFSSTICLAVYNLPLFFQTVSGCSAITSIFQGILEAIIDKVRDTNQEQCF